MKMCLPLHPFALCLVRRNWNMRVQFSLCAYFLDVSFLVVFVNTRLLFPSSPRRRPGTKVETLLLQCKWSPEAKRARERERRGYIVVCGRVVNFNFT